MKLISWNVNGLRAVVRRGFADYLREEAADVFCLQETRVTPEDAEAVWPDTYSPVWNAAPRKGYSGTAILSRVPPLRTWSGIGVEEHDGEGRVLSAEFEGFQLVNVYVPNSRRDLTRLPYRMTWDAVFRRYLENLASRKPVVVCGDFNVAHTELDLARPKSNVRSHGFTIEERKGFDDLLGAGFVDTFRQFEKAGGHYTWWSPMAGARSRNIGWRLDYFLVSDRLRPRLKSAFIRREVAGSDHCPVGIELDV